MKQALVMSGNSYVGRHVVERFIESAEYEVRITQDNSYNAVERGVSKTVSRYSHNVKEFTEGVLHSDVVIALVSNDDDCAEAHAALKILTNTCYDVEKTFVLVSSLITWSKTVNKALKSLKEHRVQERNRAIAEFRAEYGEDEELPSELQLSAEPDVNKNENVVSNGNKITVPTEQEKNEDKVDVEDKDEEMQNIIHRTYTEEDYKERACPDEYVTWRKLERYAKQVNSQTLHSYVIFAGVAYGVEQTPIVQDYMMRAFAEYKVHVSTTKHQVGEVNPPNQNSNRDINIKNKTQNNSCSEQSYQIMSEIEQKCIYYGTNYLPMIHVRDLASICFVLGNSYDVLEERYFFAIDSGTCSVQQLLYALNKSLRGDVAAVKFTALAKYSAAFAHQQRENNYTTCEFHNNMNYEIINNATTITTTTTVKKATTFPSVLSHAEQETNRYATDVIADHYTDNDDDDCHKKVDTFTNNTEKYYLMRDMMLTRRHTHIDASSLSILNYFPESKWHCYDGWMANFDRVLYEFQQSMQLKPNRVMFIGPPCSGVELIATKLADKYNVPLLTEKSVIHNFITHRDSVRAELKSLLLTRLLRRRAKAHWKRVRGEWKERKRIELEKLQARRERRAERRRAEKEKNADDEEEEEEEEEDSIDEEDEEDEEEEGIEEDEEEGDEKNVKKKNDKNTKSKTLPSSPYLIIDVNEVERASVKITEDYLLGPLHNRGRTDNNINNIDESYNYEYEHNVSEDDHDDSSMDDFAADEEMEEEEQQQHSTLEFEEEEEEEEEDELMEELRLEADKSNDNKDKLFLNNVYNDVLPPPD